MQKTAFVNIDLDFFSKPVYSGGHYIKTDYLAPTEYRSQAKIWIQPEAVMSNLLFDSKIRGASFSEDKQIISSIEKVRKEEIIEGPYTLINIDAHLDLFPFYDLELYNNRNIYANQDWLIYPFANKIIREAVWVCPNLTDEEIEQQLELLTFKYDYDNRSKRLEILSKDIHMTVWFVNWSDLMIQNYEIKYLTLTLNRHMSLVDSDGIESIRNRIKEY